MAVGTGQHVTYRGCVRGADRRRPSGLRAGGLQCCCVAVLAVMGLWLGTGATRLHLDEHLAASVSHRAAVVSAVVRPTPADDEAVPSELVLLAVALVGVLAWSRPMATGARSHPDRPCGRAPPARLLHV